MPDEAYNSAIFDGDEDDEDESAPDTLVEFDSGCAGRGISPADTGSGQVVERSVAIARVVPGVGSPSTGTQMRCVWCHVTCCSTLVDLLLSASWHELCLVQV